MLEDRRNVIHVLSVDRAEIKILVAEAQKEFAPPDRGRAIAHDRPETLFGGRCKGLQRRVVDESDTGRRRSEGQLGSLDADGFIDGRECGEEIARKMSLVMVTGKQHRLCRVRGCAESKRAIYLRDLTNPLVSQRAAQRARLGRGASGDEKK